MIKWLITDFTKNLKTEIASRKPTKVQDKTILEALTKAHFPKLFIGNRLFYLNELLESLSSINDVSIKHTYIIWNNWEEYSNICYTKLPDCKSYNFLQNFEYYFNEEVNEMKDALK